MKRKKDFLEGCLIGGAIGDALGWPVEFLKLNDIKKRFGNYGIRDFVLSSSGIAEITDDTQMTLFTAEGILRSEARGIERGVSYPPLVVYYSYQRWLHTQGFPKDDEYEWIYDGWLISNKNLHEQRAPGRTCIASLSSKKQGTISEPINNSKGCGGIMRVAPAGLFYRKDTAFNMAAEFAALTHGHPSGYLSAGALAYIIASIINGEDLETSVSHTLNKLSHYTGSEECTQSLKLALELSKTQIDDIEAISQLGEGWVGEEALAISAYCAIKYQDNFEQALISAVNHDGDSDSTGAITGNILGAYLGFKKIPMNWVEKIEMKEVLIQMADDLFIRYKKGIEWCNRYPGY